MIAVGVLAMLFSGVAGSKVREVVMMRLRGYADGSLGGGRGEMASRDAYNTV